MSDTQQLRRKRERFEAALATFIERLEADRHVLAAVLVGSLSEATIWRRESIRLWIVEADGVTRKLLSDGADERIFRTFVEGDVNLHAEIIPRERFKRMVEGTFRTAFTQTYFAERVLIYAAEPSIRGWFEEANRPGPGDQRRELMITTTWAIHPLRYTESLLEHRRDAPLAAQEILGIAHSLAAAEIVRAGEICEGEVIYRALELEPELFRRVYLDVLAGPWILERLRGALDAVHEHLDTHGEERLEPLLEVLQSDGGVVPLSRLAERFAYTQIYPWHLEEACEWLACRGVLGKVSAAFRLTRKSRVELEEPAYFLED